MTKRFATFSRLSRLSRSFDLMSSAVNAFQDYCDDEGWVSSL